MHIFYNKRAQQLNNLEIFTFPVQSYRELQICNEKMHKA